MRIRRRYLVGAVGLVLVVAAAGTGFTVATNGDDEPLTGETYDRAVAAALAHTGGGAVTETEIGDGGAAYEVEVRLEDGSQVEVQLDAAFNVIGDEPDDDSGESEGDDD